MCHACALDKINFLCHIAQFCPTTDYSGCQKYHPKIAVQHVHDSVRLENLHIRLLNHIKLSHSDLRKASKAFKIVPVIC